MSTDLPGLGSDRMQAMVYGYDQLHRIVQARSLTEYGANGYAQRNTNLEAYDVDYSYDPNGNLLSLQRLDDQTDIRDDLTYEYYKLSNRLKNVDSSIDENYRYDEIGNLTADVEEGIDSIAWTPYGKVRTVFKNDNSQIHFRYDASGNRIAKITDTDTTAYVRDASGNVMGVYRNDTLIEQSIYGSSRLGLMTASSKTGYRTLGGKKYELSNHLGNVLTVVTDNIHLDQDSTWTTLVNTTDYYPFGLAMDGRTEQDSSYRYGFNGKEGDSNGEWGSKSHYDYGFRIYNPSIAKFLSVDPLTGNYPMLTPYQFASNTPIQAIDLDGLEAVSYQIEVRGMYGIGILSIATSQTVGVVVDFNGNLAGFYTPTLGVGAGEGFVISSSFSVFKNAKSVKDIKGMGFNAGAFYAVPGVKTLVGGGELNLALNDDFSINKVGGTASGSFVPGPNWGIGIGGYLEGSYTLMTDVINVNDFENSKIFHELVNDFGIDKSYLMNAVDDIYNKAKDLREQTQPGNPKGLDEFLREKNISPMDATTVQSKEHIRQNSDDR